MKVLVTDSPETHFMTEEEHVLYRFSFELLLHYRDVARYIQRFSDISLL